MDLCLTLRYLGVPLRERSYMFGDNESVVNSSMTPTGKLHKRHTALNVTRHYHGTESAKLLLLAWSSIFTYLVQLTQQIC
jgi:hypothetical protein